MNLNKVIREEIKNFHFNSGDCDIYAISLHRLYNYPLFVIRGYYLEDGELNYEDAHIMVKLPNGKYLDSNGEQTKEEILPKAMFSNKISKVEIVSINEEEALNTFSCQNQEDDISKVMNTIKNNSVLNELEQNLNELLNENVLKEEYMNMNDIIVWHGSTRKFDQFDMSMVGTGDQNNLGGWGIYFSDNKDVSKRYYLPSGQLKQYKLRSGDYFDLDASVDDGERILNALKKLSIAAKDLQEFEETYVNTDNYTAINKNVYDWLTYILKSEKNTSLFLNKLNYIGNTMLDRWERDAQNYVIFNTEDIIGEIEPDEDEYNNRDNNSDDENY
jgi:hypothetical protein